MAESLPQSPGNTFDGLVQRAEDLTRAFEQHPNSAVREDALELLQTVDAIHREAILRLVELMVESGNHELIHRAAEDPRVSTLFQLYDVMPLPEQVRWQEALDGARDDLRSSNAGVELLQVTGGMPHLRLTGAFTNDESKLRDIVNDAITSIYGPIQSVRWEPRSRPPVPSGLISIAAIQPAKMQQWVKLTESGQLEPNELRNMTVRRTDLVLCRSESGYHAFPNACPGTALPLHLGKISESKLVCPWHACAFDLATGKRTSGIGLELKPLTLRRNGGVVELGVWE